MKKTIINLDEQFQRTGQRGLNRLTPGLLKARGVFETMRTYRGKIFGYREHCRRMRRGLRVLKIKPPASFLRDESLIYRVMQKNRLSDARIRLMCWKDKKNKVYAAVVCQPLALPKRGSFRVMVSSLIHPQNRLSRLKTLDYEIFHKAYAQARRLGFDEALLLNKKGEAVEASRANLFAVKGGILYTPPVSSGCLEGITRSFVIACAKRAKIVFGSKKLTEESLLNADEVFLTNSVSGIVFVSQIGGARIGTGQAGVITRRLKMAYQELTEEGLRSG